MLGARAGGGRAPGGADPVKDLSLSTRWRNSGEVSVPVATGWQALSGAASYGSFECGLDAMLVREKRKGRSGPAFEVRLDLGSRLSSDCKDWRCSSSPGAMSTSEVEPEAIRSRSARTETLKCPP